MEFALEPAGQDDPDIAWCLGQYYAELADRFAQGFDPAQSLSTSAEEVTPPAGVFLIARTADGRPVGCGALRSVGGSTGEIKRMWVAPDVRGRGLARQILASLESRARSFGLGRVRLDTNDQLPEAMALYRGSGYEEVDRFNDDRYPTHFFVKELSEDL